MTTFDNAPPPADWKPTPGFVCGGCGASANLCRVLMAEPVNEPCCPRCSHAVAAESTCKVWEGDQA